MTFVLCSPFLLCVLIVVAAYAKSYVDHRRAITQVAWTAFGVRRRALETERSLRARCIAVARMR